MPTRGITDRRLSRPPPKKSCLDGMRNALARTAAQISTGHWRSAVYLKRIGKRADDKCWFCQGPAEVTRSHVLLHCPNEKLRSAKIEEWEGKNLGGVRVLLAIPRWKRRFVRFLESSRVGRTMANGRLSAVYLKRIRKRAEDRCWFRQGPA